VGTSAHRLATFPTPRVAAQLYLEHATVALSGPAYERDAWLDGATLSFRVGALTECDREDTAVRWSGRSRLHSTTETTNDVRHRRLA
jgi:hypothetical protein